MQSCKICYSSDTHPLPFDIPEEAGRWRRCKSCGSDSSSNSYADVKHVYEDREAYDKLIGITDAGIEKFRDGVRWNCEWFGHHAKHLPNRDFLDIGTWHGACLDVMQRLGWSVHGFDVVPPPFTGSHVTVKPHFSRWWFQLRFGAALAMEVIEHLDSPILFLHECHGVLCPGGLLQVQTPAPRDYYNWAVYQEAHLSIISKKAMETMLHDAMFDILDFREWGHKHGEQPGQAWMCKARS